MVPGRAHLLSLHSSGKSRKQLKLYCALVEDEPDYAALNSFGLGRLFYAIRDGAIVGDVETEKITLWNRSAERIFGYSSSEATGMPLHLLVPERLRKEHRAGLRRFRMTGRGDLVDGGTHISLPALHKDGHEIKIELTLSPLPDVKGGNFVLALIRDVTDRHELEKMRQEFIARAAHELRNPVTTMIGFAHLLEHRSRMTEDQLTDALAAIGRQTKRLEQITRQMLDLAKIEGGAITLQRHTISLADALRRVLDERPPAAGIQVNLQIDSDACVLADPSRFEQVLTNLLSNAYRYGGDRVVITSRADESSVIVSISDNGPGVPDELQPELFQSFVAGPNSDSHGGSGLGLAIVRSLVEAMDGRVWHEPAAPHGARFLVQLARPPAETPSGASPSDPSD